MKTVKVSLFLCLLVLVSAVSFTSLIKAQTIDPTTEPLLDQDDVVYLGAFRVPGGNFGTPGGSDTDAFSYAGNGLAYNPANNSLFITGTFQHYLTGEISIPGTIVNSSNINDLTTATVIQNFADVTNGGRTKIEPAGGYSNGDPIGGYLVYGGKLYSSAYAYYAGSGSVIGSHFVSPLDLSQANTASGPFKVGNLEPGYVGGWMGLIPPEWQSLFGGPAFTGLCCISVISSRSSEGPTMSVFNPADIGAKNPVPANPLLFYPLNDSVYGTHETLGGYYSGGVSGPYYAATTVIWGSVFPTNSRSILFFGSRGVGPFCYGTPNECNDNQGSKGPHSAPYVFQVWAYDANDLVAVKNGQKQPWEITPYTGWTFNLPIAPTSPISVFPAITGAAYDPNTNRIYLLQEETDIVGFSHRPIIHVFQIQPKTSKPVISFGPAKTTISQGQSATLFWNVTNATSVSIDNGIGTVSSSGSKTVSPIGPTSYKITATNVNGTTTKYVLVQVDSPGLPVATSFTATPQTITAGQSTILKWTTNNAASVTLSYTGPVPVNNQITLSPTTTTTYRLTVANPYTYVTQELTVNVLPSSTTTGDLNNDGKVDIFDYNILIGNFGKTGAGLVGDLNSDGKVDIFDYNLLVGNFGK